MNSCLGAISSLKNNAKKTWSPPFLALQPLSIFSLLKASVNFLIWCFLVTDPQFTWAKYTLLQKQPCKDPFKGKKYVELVEKGLKKKCNWGRDTTRAMNLSIVNWCYKQIPYFHLWNEEEYTFGSIHLLPTTKKPLQIPFFLKRYLLSFVKL